MISKFCKIIMKIRAWVKCIWIQEEMIVKEYIIAAVPEPQPETWHSSVWLLTNAVTENSVNLRTGKRMEGEKGKKNGPS